MSIPLGHAGTLLWTYLQSLRLKVLALALCLAARLSLQLIGPQITRVFVDGAQAGRAVSALLALGALFFGAALARSALASAATYLAEDVGWTATNALRADLALHLLRLDMAFHTAHTPGELIERVDGDVSALAGFFSDLVVNVVANLALLAGVLAVLMLTDWRLGLVGVAFVGGAFAVLYWLRDLAGPRSLAARQVQAEFSGFLEERLAATEDIQAAGAAGYTRHQHFALTRRVWRAELSFWLTFVTMSNATGLLFLAGTVLALGVGGALYLQHLLTLGTVVMIYQYMQAIFQPVSTLNQELQHLQGARTAIQRIGELLATRSALTMARVEVLARPGDPTGHPDVHMGVAVPPALTFEGVSFGYGDGEEVLHDVSFRLEPGQVLGVLGRTGGGKSTLARLAFRLYDPLAGTILLHGVDMRTLAQAEVRRQVGLVAQEVQLFRATVRDNLTFFDPGVPDARLMEVLDELGLGPWYAALPRGLETEIASGEGMSAGQAQLLALARVFLRDPSVIVLDEASSRLDPATERLMERALDRLLAGRAAIVIAHRLATVERADTILVLEAGQVQEYGARDSLAADAHSRFSALLRTGLAGVVS